MYGTFGPEHKTLEEKSLIAHSAILYSKLGTDVSRVSPHVNYTTQYALQNQC